MEDLSRIIGRNQTKDLLVNSDPTNCATNKRKKDPTNWELTQKLTNDIVGPNYKIYDLRYLNVTEVVYMKLLFQKM